MTRTQLKAMSTRDLIAHAKRAADNLIRPDGDLLLELADRLDDCYVFETEEHPTNTYQPWEKEPAL